jgi:hypothetical protein
MKNKPTPKEPEGVSVNEIQETKNHEERTPLVSPDPRLSLLAPLPHYSSSSKSTTSKTKYV